MSPYPIVPVKECFKLWYNRDSNYERKESEEKKIDSPSIGTIQRAEACKGVVLLLQANQKLIHLQVNWEVRGNKYPLNLVSFFSVFT